MKYNIKHTLIWIILYIGNLSVYAQDIQFSQFYSAKFNIAPSFAGASDGGRLTMLFKDQWPCLKNTFVTYGIALDHDLLKLNGGVGIWVLQDFSNGRGLTNSHAGIQYSYSIKLNNTWEMRPGLQLSTINKKLDLSKIIFGSQLTFDESDVQAPYRIKSTNTTIFDAAISFLLHSENIWFGASVDHINIHYTSFTGEKASIPMKWTSFGGIRLKSIQGRLLHDKEYFYFSYLFKHQNKFKQLDLGLYWTIADAKWLKNSIELGVWYRGLPFFKDNYNQFYNSALIFKVGMSYKYFDVGYSCDYSLSKINSITGGAHELSMVYLFNQGNIKRKKKYKMVPSPKF